MKKAIFGGSMFIGGCLIALAALVSPVLSAEERPPILYVSLIIVLLGLAFGVMGLFYEGNDGKRK